MKTYQHTQPGTTILRCMTTVLLIFLIASTVIHPLILTAIFLAGLTWVFRSMTVEVSETELTWYFGSGRWRKSVRLEEIAAVEPIRTAFWYGWGIHYTPRGWLYNVSGYGAVAITLRSGRRFCVGTDEPEELARELARGRGQ